MSKASEHRQAVQSLLDEIGEDLSVFGGDVEGHLRVAEAHLRAVLSGRRLRVMPTEAEDPEAEDPDELDDDVVRPPEKGPGSSLAAWMAYAEARGIVVRESADKASVIAAVKAAEAEDPDELDDEED